MGDKTALHSCFRAVLLLFPPPPPPLPLPLPPPLPPRRRPLLEDDVEEDEDMVKHGENAVHLTSLFLERLRLFGM